MDKTVKEAIEEKNALQKEFLKMIKEYEYKFGVDVSRIDVQKVMIDSDYKLRTNRIKIGVEL